MGRKAHSMLRDCMSKSLEADRLWNAQERDVAVGLCLKGLLLSPRWVPESAHWLLTQGHVEEAHRYLLHCSRLNGWPMGEDSLSQEVRMNVCECMQVHVCGGCMCVCM